jgi:hypothetical protein
LSHSSASNPAVAYVRDRVHQGLVSQKSLKILLDVRMLGAGDEWRPVLHQWLGECDSAVLLLSQEAISSAWVQKEATILTWRRSLGSSLKIVPVLIGCTRKQVVDDPAFAPLDLGSIQFESLDVGPELTAADLADPRRLAALDAAVDKLISALVSQLRTIAVDTGDLPMRRWVRDVTVALGKVADSYVVDAAESLGVSARVQAEVQNLRATVAHQFLTSPLPRVHGALRALRPGHLLPEDYRWLVDLVVPVWVPALAGRNFLNASTASVGHHTVAINALREETGMHYVARATCGQASAGEIVSVNDVTGIDHGAELLERYQRAIWRETGLTGLFNLQKLARYLAADDVRQYVLLGPEAVGPALEDLDEDDVLLQLVERYGEAVFVVLVGGELWPQATACRALVCVSPELGDDDEDDVEVLLTKIDKLRQTRLIRSAHATG